jgi:hypothetical protein
MVSGENSVACGNGNAGGVANDNELAIAITAQIAQLSSGCRLES